MEDCEFGAFIVPPYSNCLTIFRIVRKLRLFWFIPGHFLNYRSISLWKSDTLEIFPVFESRGVLVFSRFCAQSRSSEPLHCVMAYFCPKSRLQVKCIFIPKVLMSINKYNRHRFKQSNQFYYRMLNF